MYRFFQELPTMNKGSIVLPEFIFVKGFYLRQLATLREYYHNNLRNVRNEHLLVRLLLSLNVSFNRNIRNYVDTVGDQALMLSSQLRMTSALNHGFGFSPGVFYGRDVLELIIASDEEFDLTDAVANWRDLEPVRVLRHPFTDLSLGRPDGDYEASDEKGIAVIEVNVAKLALQYRMWCEQEKGDEEGSRNSVHQFIAMYPLTNMINSHLDIALFNRMVALYNDEPVAPFKKTHPFFIPDYTDKVDAVLRKTIKLHQGRKMEFDHILLNIPMINNDTLFEAMMLPRVTPTRQVKWALIIARLPLMKFLVKLNDDTNNRRNTMYLGKLRIALREMRSDNTLYQGLPRDIVQEIDDGIEQDITAYL